MYEVRAELSPENFRRAENLIFESEGLENWNLYENSDDKTYWIQGVFQTRSEVEAGRSEMRSKLPGPMDWAVRKLEEADWREGYRDHFQPWSAGGLHWVPVWLKGDYRLPESAEAVWLDPGMAFGTGNHATTRLCVEQLLKFRNARAGHPSLRVVDAGCGSGILAISAARLGFRFVEGFDIDADAVRIARENARLNGVEQVRFSLGGLRDRLAPAGADCLMANILADVLVKRSRLLIDALAPGGWLVLSGLLESEASRVGEHFSSEGAWTQVSMESLGEWASLTLVRKGGEAADA